MLKTYIEYHTLSNKGNQHHIKVVPYRIPLDQQPVPSCHTGWHPWPGGQQTPLRCQSESRRTRPHCDPVRTMTQRHISDKNWREK